MERINNILSLDMIVTEIYQLFFNDPDSNDDSNKNPKLSQA